MSARVNSGAQGQLALEGELTFANAMDMRSQLQQALASMRGDIILDLSAVTRSNSVGLSLILLVARIVSERGDRLRVVSLPVGLHSIARVCELDDWLDARQA